MSREVTVLGAGCTGPLLGAMLAARGASVEVYERRADPRHGLRETGRSINLALAARGLHALEQAGLRDRVNPWLVPMRGRLLHAPDVAAKWRISGFYAVNVTLHVLWSPPVLQAQTTRLGDDRDALPVAFHPRTDGRGGAGGAPRAVASGALPGLGQFRDGPQLDHRAAERALRG